MERFGVLGTRLGLDAGGGGGGEWQELASAARPLAKLASEGSQSAAAAAAYSFSSWAGRQPNLSATGRPTTNQTQRAGNGPDNLLLLLPPRFFYFSIFLKHFLQKYIFGFKIYSSIPLPPGRRRQGAGRHM